MSEDLKINRPIKGDVQFGSTARVPQKGVTEFLDAIDGLLAVDGVEDVAWVQYIPSFNDGDPCEFSVQEVYVKLDKRFFSEEELANMDEEDDEDYGLEEQSRRASDYSLRKTNYSNPGRPERVGLDYKEWQKQDAIWREANSTYDLNGQDTRTIYDALAKLNMAEFEDVVRSNFGDNATVTATTDGFEVDYYESY